MQVEQKLVGYSRRTLSPPAITNQTRSDVDQQKKSARPENNLDVIREFRPFGSAAALFVMFGAYRGGSNTFAVVGLGSKPLYSFGNPQFECEWVPSAQSSISAASRKSEIAYRMLPDVGYGRVYTVVVVNCTFSEPIGTDRKGGQLVLHASYGDGLGKPAERIVALTEEANAYNASLYQPPYPYDYLYCGSPLFGTLNAQRIKEWIAYHITLFGPRSHFVFHDAGGMHDDVRAVLEPWRKLGYVTVQNIKQQAEYDGHYYNQFLIVNDCLHRTRFLANWTFFFDVDEYIYIAPQETMQSAMAWFSNCTMVQFSQVRMSNSICQANETLGDSSSRWGFEKLVYKDMAPDYVKTASKYAVQARNVFATGVHNSDKSLNHMQGEVGWAWLPRMRYYHYHNTIVKDGEVCSEFSKNISHTYNGVPFELDTSMRYMGPLVKQFELQQIGPIIQQ